MIVWLALGSALAAAFIAGMLWYDVRRLRWRLNSLEWEFRYFEAAVMNDGIPAEIRQEGIHQYAQKRERAKAQSGFENRK